MLTRCETESAATEASLPLGLTPVTWYIIADWEYLILGGWGVSIRARGLILAKKLPNCQPLRDDDLELSSPLIRVHNACDRMTSVGPSLLDLGFLKGSGTRSWRVALGHYSTQLEGP